MIDPRDTTEPHSTTPRVSVVIPTHNRRASLERVLRALAHQTVSPASFEVVLVVDGCTDGTAEMSRRLSLDLPYALRVIEQTNAGPAAARNRGLAEARATLIVFLDDDVVPDEHLIGVHLAAHSTEEEDKIVAIGPLLPPPDTRLNAWGAWEEHTLCTHYAQIQAGRWNLTHRQFYTGNASLYKRHVVAVGGFDPRYQRAEDIELGLRMRTQLGCQFVFLPDARGWHYVHRTFASWARMPVAYGRTEIMMRRREQIGDVAWLTQLYLKRNLPTRFCIRLCLGSSMRVAFATHLLHAMAVMSWALRLSAVTYAACGVLYNLRYYVGFASELGGSRNFWHWIRLSRGAFDTFERAEVLRAETARLLSINLREEREPTELGVGA